jgi:TRAP-type C4-dicarboxylate transport system substrate-binding protein
VSVIITSAIYELQGNMALTGHFYMASPMFVSTGVWNKLSERERALLTEAARDAVRYHREVGDGFMGPGPLDMLRGRMAVADGLDIAEWRKAVVGLRDDYRGEIGAENLEELDGEIARVAPEWAAWRP